VRYAAAAGRRVEKVPLGPAWEHDLGRMREAVSRAGGAALVFLCNPNNPTGTLTPCSDVEAWLREADERTTFIVDEAYFEFAEDPAYRSMQPIATSRPNVIMVRTFSKIHAMAGMRLGYAIAHPDAIRRLRAWVCTNNANILALAAARESLGDTAFHERSLASNRAGRRLLIECLDELGLEHLPSHTNFVMHRIPGEVSALVGRAFPPLLAMSRVSIGLPEEMAEFVRELRDFRARGFV
jgi:histidinol-phosphate aminotransferase